MVGRRSLLIASGCESLAQVLKTRRIDPVRHCRNINAGSLVAVTTFHTLKYARPTRKSPITGVQGKSAPARVRGRFALQRDRPLGLER
jgi:hypothetical protein